MTPPSPLRFARLTRDLLVGLTALFVWWLLLMVPRLWFPTRPKASLPADFSLYYGAAKVLYGSGPGSIYNLGLQRVQYELIHPVALPFTIQTYFVTPPPAAWLVALIAWIPYPAAYWLWDGVMVVAYLVVGLAVCGGSTIGRAAAVLGGLGSYLVMTNLHDGQIALLVGLSVGACLYLLERDRPVAAGIVLSGILLKPQVAYLVPPALLIWGARRTFVAWALASGAWLALSLLSLGVGGAQSWWHDLGLENHNLYNQIWTLALIVGPGRWATVLELGSAILTLAVAWRLRGRGARWPIAVGLVGTMLAADYHHASDFIALVIAFLIYLGTRPALWQWPWLGFGCVVAYFTAPWGPAPILIFSAGWLLILTGEAFWGRPSTPRPPAGLTVPAPLPSG